MERVAQQHASPPRAGIFQRLARRVGLPTSEFIWGLLLLISMLLALIVAIWVTIQAGPAPPKTGALF